MDNSIKPTFPQASPPTSYQEHPSQHTATPMVTNHSDQQALANNLTSERTHALPFYAVPPVDRDNQLKGARSVEKVRPAIQLLMLNYIPANFDSSYELRKAASKGDFDRVKSELAKGGDTHQLGAGRHHAVTKATSDGHYDIVKRLLEHGANADAWTIDDETPSGKETPLYRAGQLHQY